MHNGNELKGFQRLQEYISKKSKITNASILSGQKAAAEYLQEAMRGRSAPRGRSSPQGSRRPAQGTARTAIPDGCTSESPPSLYIPLPAQLLSQLPSLRQSHIPPGKRKKKAGEQRTVKAQPHLKPEFDKNQDQLVKIMIETMEKRVNNGDCQF